MRDPRHRHVFKETADKKGIHVERWLPFFYVPHMQVILSESRLVVERNMPVTSGQLVHLILGLRELQNGDNAVHVGPTSEGIMHRPI